MSITNYNWTPEHIRFAVDLNGDGRADIVGIGPDCVWTCLNRDGLGFTEPTFAVVAFEANAGWQIANHPRFVMDLTGDGRADIIGFGDDGVWVCLGNGGGGFQEARFVVQEFGFNQGWRVDKHPRFVTDLTGTGRADILGFAEDGVWVSLGNGDGSFQSAGRVSGDLAFNTGWRVDKHPRFLADLTGDGRADIVGFGDDGVWVCLGNGDGSFRAAMFVSQDLAFNTGWRVDKHPRFVTDLTGDGRADIVGFGDDGVWVCLGNGDGGFQPARFVLQELGFNQGWRVDSHPRFLTDLTGDGRADIVGFGNDGVWVALGNGDGSFQPARFVLAGFGANASWRVGDHPRFVADVNGDGRSDIVGFGDDGIWVALGNGDGTFQEARFVLADLGRRSNRDTIVRTEIVRDHRQRDRIKHVFVLMLENRSYDHMLGFADIRGTDAATGEPTGADGLKGMEFNCLAGKRYQVIRGAPDVTVDPGHNFNATLEQLCGVHAKHPNGGPYPDVNNTGFVANMAKRDSPDRAGGIMRCFAPEHVPILTTLAREFAVCDRWFCSMPGPTEPNRMFLHAASSGEFDDSPTAAEIGEASTNPFGGFEFKGGTIFDALKEAGVKWRIYAGDDFPVVGELDGVSNTFDVLEFEDFAEDLQNPDFDAAFIHIEPDYFGGLFNTGEFGKGNSQHPDGGVAAGERLIKATYEAIRNSPHWDSSMLIVTYDEHGGFYDHVAPGAAAPTGSIGRKHGFRFDQLGPRVPAVVISPLIAKGTIEHRLLEHCSVITTVMDLFDVPPLRHARDLRQVCGLSHLAQLSEARQDTPARLPEVVVSDVPSAIVPVARETFRERRRRRIPALALQVSDEDMISMAVRSAAIEDITTLEPERRAEVVSRVANIRTRGEAVAFLMEVEAKMEAARPH
jgi:phospholipase C